MKRMIGARWMVSIVIAIILLGSLAVTASAVDLRRIVVFYEGTPVEVQLQVVASWPGLLPISVLHILSLINAVAIELPPLETQAAEDFLWAVPTVQRVDGDPLVGLQGQGGDGQGGDGGSFVTSESAPSQEFYPWGINRIGAADVQEQYPGLTGAGVKVALIDTGVDRTHPDLQGSIVGGYNAIAQPDPKKRGSSQEPNNWDDDNGHGTHVAGTMAAWLNNQGVIGVAPRVRIYVLKALDRNGQGRTSDVIDALQHVTPDIRVIAGSCGTDLVWPSFEDAIHRLYQSGKLMVFSAGNNCTSCTTTPPPDIKFPARYPGVIAVGASDANVNDQVPGFSRSGPAMTDHGVVAPGVDIFSINLVKLGGYGSMTGTSASTPHVTGAVALALQLRPQMTYEDWWYFVRQTAKPLYNNASELYPSDQQGAGRLDVKTMVPRLMQGR